MNDYDRKKEEFLQLIKPLFDQEFYGSHDKSIFVSKWREIVENNEFCKINFSYRKSEYYSEEEDGEEFHQDFHFSELYDYTDCTRESNPDCLSGRLCFCFGLGSAGTQLAYIHTNYKNMAISHDDDIYLSDDIDEAVSNMIKRSNISFLDFINILKPEVTKTMLMKKDNYSQWLQIEKNKLFIRYSCNISTDNKWEYGDKVFQTDESANAFYYSFINKYAKENILKLSSCSSDVKSEVEMLISRNS